MSKYREDIVTECLEELRGLRIVLKRLLNGDAFTSFTNIELIAEANDQVKAAMSKIKAQQSILEQELHDVQCENTMLGGENMDALIAEEQIKVQLLKLQNRLEQC
jgi:hypothetical protein